MQVEFGVVLVTEDLGRLLECLPRLIECSGAPVAIQVVGYGPEAQALAEVARGFRHDPERVVITSCWVDSGSPVEAVNRGLRGLRVVPTPHVAVVSDDARVASGWLLELRKALAAESVMTGEIGWRGGDYGMIGFAGPVTDQTQIIAQRIELTEGEVAGGLDRYAADRRAHLEGCASVAELIDGFCLLGTAQAWTAVSRWDGAALEEGLGSWAWADLFVRARRMRQRVVVAEGCYIGRARTIRTGAWDAGDGADRIAFYRTHAQTQAPKVIALVRARIGSLQQLQTLRGVVASLAPRCDGVAVLLGNNPLDIQDDPGFQAAAKAGGGGVVSPADLTMLRACSGASPDRVARAFGEWCVTMGRAAGGQGFQALARAWDGVPDEFGERCALHEMGARLGATWILSVEQDEILEESVTRAFLHRLAQHPDPSVRAYDLALLTAWDSPTLIREDAPWGDGGTWRGGPSAVRMWRAGELPMRTTDGNGVSAGPVIGEDGVRIASIRVRKFGLLRAADRAARGVVDSGESIRCYAYQPENRAGFHQLVYSRENADDVARWLDVAHGLCDRAVLVWTEEELPPEDSPWRTLTDTWGAMLVHQPLRDDLARARNEGIDVLRLGGGLTWGWFTDPDEWFAQPLADAKAMRRMFESSRWGWLWQVANYRADGPPTVSDSVRVSRLDPAMRMDGRVHEGFSGALAALTDRGIHPRLVYAPFVAQHRGMAFAAERIREKLDKYERMLRLELEDNQHNPGAWVSLGWHYLNDGHEAEGVECLHRAVACAGRSYLPFRELAYHHLRIARSLIAASRDRLTTGHQWWKASEELAQVLARVAPDLPVMARGTERPMMPLPAWTPPVR